MKRVLIISYYWPPTGGSGVQRWVKFSKYLPAEGWQPVIYTPENPEMLAEDTSLESEVPPEAEVIRRKIVEPYGLYRKLTGKGKEGKTEVNPANASKKNFKEKLSLFIRGNFFIPDPRCFWIQPSARFLKKYLREHPVDVIVSTGPPQSMHLIARKVAKASGTPWVADFRDPWTKLFYFKHLGLTRLSAAIHRKLEKKVLDSADVIVAVSPLVREDFLSMTDTPVELITNGFDEDDFKGEINADGLFNITHTGLFASDGNPENVWSVLARMCDEDTLFKEKLRIRLAGKTDREIIGSIKAHGLEGNLVDLGYQDHMDAVREQRMADILLLPLRKEPEYKAVLPGKLFEYLAARKPILGIGQDDGAMAGIIRETCSGEVKGWNDTEGVRKFISTQWEAFKEGRSCFEGGNISKFSRKELASALAELLEKTVRV